MQNTFLLHSYMLHCFSDSSKLVGSQCRVLLSRVRDLAGSCVTHRERERELLTRVDRRYIAATISESKEEHTEVIHPVGEQFPAVPSSRDTVRFKLGKRPHCSRQPPAGQVLGFFL